MTASTSPRLGLMLPADTDDFLPSDFVDSMTKLDNRPGILPVANYAALPTGLTSANHGSCYLTEDTGSLWMWNRPGSAAGSWQKINNCGQLFSQNMSAQVSTAQTDETKGVTLLSGTFTAPGGRTMLAQFSHPHILNSGTYGFAQLSMWIDGSVVERSYMGGVPNRPFAHRLIQGMSPRTPGATVTVEVTMCCTTFSGGTATANSTGHMNVWEI